MCLCVCIHLHVYLCVSASARMCMYTRRAEDSHRCLLFLRQGLKLTKQVKLASQVAPGINLSLSSQNWAYKHACLTVIIWFPWTKL